MSFSRSPPEQAAHFVSREASPRTVVANGDRESVGVGVVCDDEVNAGLVGGVEREIERAGFLGVGEGNRWECAIGVNLCGDDNRVAETGLEVTPVGYLPADSVHRGVDEPNRCCRAGR